MGWSSILVFSERNVYRNWACQSIYAALTRRPLARERIASRNNFDWSRGQKRAIRHDALRGIAPGSLDTSCFRVVPGSTRLRMVYILSFPLRGAQVLPTCCTFNLSAIPRIQINLTRYQHRYLRSESDRGAHKSRKFPRRTRHLFPLGIRIGDSARPQRAVL